MPPALAKCNAAFVGRPETGLRYYNAATDSGDLVFDHYTGVGEVLAVHDLDQVFSALHRQVRVKRGSLFSLDNVRNNNLILWDRLPKTLLCSILPGRASLCSSA